MINRFFIERIVDTYHVATDFETIRADLARRMSDPRWTDALRQEAFDYALEVHNTSRLLYNQVMTGQFQ